MKLVSLKLESLRMTISNRTSRRKMPAHLQQITKDRSIFFFFGFLEGVDKFVSKFNLYLNRYRTGTVCQLSVFNINLSRS